MLHLANRVHAAEARASVLKTLAASADAKMKASIRPFLTAPLAHDVRRPAMTEPEQPSIRARPRRLPAQASSRWCRR